MTRFVFILLFFTAGITRAGEEVVIELSEVPDAVSAVIAERFANVTLTGANTETETDGSVVYEIQGIIPEGQWLENERSTLIDDDGDVVGLSEQPPNKSRKVEFDLTPEAELLEIEIEFDSGMLPGAVTKAITNAYPDFKATFIEASYSDSMDVVGYEFVGMRAGEPLDLEVSPSGRHIIIADN